MHSLKQIAMLRETKKHTLLEKVLKEQLSYEQVVEVIPGQVSLIQFLVQNTFPQDEVFQIVVDGDEEAPNNELHLAHNEGEKEWQFWFHEKKCPAPIGGWDSVSSKGDVMLRSGQQCPLLLKYISYREGVSQTNPASDESMLKPKKIKVTMISRNNLPMQTLVLRIKPKEQYCDQVFRFYEPQSTKCYLRLPKGFAPFFSLVKGMSVKTSNKLIQPDLNFETGEVCLVAQTELAPRMIECFVFLYQDHL